MIVIAVLPAAILLYIGPDQTIPIASYLATLVGLVLIFWNKLLGVARRLIQKYKELRKPS
jgi:hypothetical protein